MLDGLPPDVAASLLSLAADYEILARDDSGANGYVIFAKNRHHSREVAIKFYYRGSDQTADSEAHLLARIESSNVLTILDARAAPGGWVYHITPRCTEGTLETQIATKMSLHAAIDTTLGLCAGASAIHMADLVHRDLKPANVVVQDRKPLIADFGSVLPIDSTGTASSAAGHTILYRPPESHASNCYTASGDLYQIGIVAYQLLGGVLPSDGLHYLSRAELAQYKALDDDFERSQLVDGAVRTRAQGETLLNFASLPPWVSNSLKASLRRAVRAAPERRTRSLSRLVSEFTIARAASLDWTPHGDGVRLAKGGRQVSIELSATSGLYEAFYIDSGRRRVPRVASGALADVVRAISE